MLRVQVLFSLAKKFSISAIQFLGSRRSMCRVTMTKMPTVLKMNVRVDHSSVKAGGAASWSVILRIWRFWSCRTIGASAAEYFCMHGYKHLYVSLRLFAAIALLVESFLSGMFFQQGNMRCCSLSWWSSLPWWSKHERAGLWPNDSVI